MGKPVRPMSVGEFQNYAARKALLEIKHLRSRVSYLERTAEIIERLKTISPIEWFGGKGALTDEQIAAFDLETAQNFLTVMRDKCRDALTETAP